VALFWLLPVGFLKSCAGYRECVLVLSNWRGDFMVQQFHLFFYPDPECRLCVDLRSLIQWRSPEYLYIL
jgi:hypothetical protein